MATRRTEIESAIDGPRLDRRWGDQTRVDADNVARDRLISAAEECFRALGLDRTSMEDVARKAKVSRRTVYRYFKDRDALVVATLVRESEQVFDAVQQVMQGPGTFADRTVDTILRTLERIRTSPTLMHLLGPDASPLAVRAAFGSAILFDKAREVYGPWFALAEAEGDVPEEMHLDAYVEWQVRILVSLLTQDRPMSAERGADRHFLEVFVRPAFERTTARKASRSRTSQRSAASRPGSPKTPSQD